VKKLLLALAGIALAASAVADLTKFKDWDKSPEAYFLTPAERTEWKNVKTDDDAEKFVALYYARRGGDSFKQEVSRRIAAADQQFKLQRYKRGADSVRGHLLIVLGAPTRVAQKGGAIDAVPHNDANPIDAPPVGAPEEVLYTWTYAADKFPASMGIGELKAQVSVEPALGKDSLENAKEVEKAMATVAEKSIVNPNASIGAPGASAAAGAAKAAPAPPAPAPAAAPAMALPAAVKSALEAGAANAGDAGFYSGVFRSASGDALLAIQFYLPTDKPAFAGGGPLKFAGTVTDESGKEVGSYWEDAVFLEVAEGSRKDRVVDRSVTLPPGSYKGSFALFAAEGQPPVASSSVNFKLTPKSGEFAVSPLILSSGLVPLTKRPGPADPFVFGTDKPFRVEPKGDRTFSKNDSLWYFYGVENPALPAPPADAAAAPAAEAPKPRILTKINVKKDGKDAFAPFTGPADLVENAPGVYNTGSEIPLASFEPGYYTFLILVRDRNAPQGSEAQKGIERQQDFVVLMPDGSLPPKSKPAAAPAPKKKS
jgi:GWxTD domain-containing protein